MDTLAGMQLFMRVVQAGSFSAAGRQVGLSPASVFRAINALEDQLGARLLNRTSRRLTLTEAGTLYAAKLETILADIEDANTELTQLQRTPRGTLRVHTRVSLGTRHLAPLLPSFLLKYPELRVDLRLSDDPIDLTEANIDVAIRVGDISGSSLVIRKLASSPRFVCASPDYLKRHGTPETPADLLAHNCVTFRSEENQPTWRFLKDNELIELQIRGSLCADHGDALREAALAGLGIALLPAWSIGADLQTGRLQALLPAYEATPFGFDPDIYVVTHQARYRALKVGLFLDFLDTAFRPKVHWQHIGQTTR
jgi:DNA-binding transcriptional LysR family regulator